MPPVNISALEVLFCRLPSEDPYKSFKAPDVKCKDTSLVRGVVDESDHRNYRVRLWHQVLLTPNNSSIITIINFLRSHLMLVGPTADINSGATTPE